VTAWARAQQARAGRQAFDWPAWGRILGVGIGFAWLAGNAATGQRYPGASLAWLLPAALALAGLASGLGLLVGLARILCEPAPVRMAERAARPLWLAWAIVLLLVASPEANHYFAHWPRLRAAALAGVLALAAVAAELVALRMLERRFRLLSRLASTAGRPLMVFGAALCLYLASAGGHLYTPDEWTIYATAAGLVHHGVPAAFDGEPYPLHYLAGPRPAGDGSDGRPSFVYSKYGIVPSLLAAPVYAIGRWLGQRPDLPTQAFPFENRALPLVPLLVNPVVTAAVAALLFTLARDLGYDRRAALVAAGAFGAGSLAWPFSKTLMNMTLAGGLLLASLWGLARATGAITHRRRRAWLLLAGVMAGLAVATRYEALLFTIPLLALAGRRPPAAPGVAGGRVFPVLLFTGGAGATIVPLVLGYNLLRTGSLLDVGYAGEGTLSTVAEKPWYGLFGILFSPGCGLLAHTPLMLLGLAALVWLWEDRAEALAVGAICGLAIVYYGSLSTWCGYATWGPRYLLVVAPFMALPLAALWRRLAGHRPNPFAWLLLGGTAAWSVGANALAVLIDFNRGWQDHWAHDLDYIRVTWLPYFTGITTHLRLLRQWLLDGAGGLDLYVLYLHPVLGPVALALLLTLALALGAGAWLAPDAAPAGAAGARSARAGGPTAR
jgi:hypothetical protein